MPVPTPRTQHKPMKPEGKMAVYQGGTNCHNRLRSVDGAQKGHPCHKLICPKLRRKRKYLRFFLVLPKWDCINFKKEMIMTVTATNALILGAVFMFAARVFLAF